MIESIEQGLSVERTLELSAPVDRVWRALTEPEELVQLILICRPIFL